MCNPPFYSDREEVLRSAEAKELGPNAVCTGADTEMITPGGEVMFVRKMVEESLILKTRCRYVQFNRNMPVEQLSYPSVDGTPRCWAKWPH